MKGRGGLLRSFPADGDRGQAGNGNVRCHARSPGTVIKGALGRKRAGRMVRPPRARTGGIGAGIIPAWLRPSPRAKIEVISPPRVELAL